MKRGPLAAAVALDVVIALADAITGERVVLTGLFLVAPLGLALVGHTRDVAGVAALSVVLALLSGVWDEYLFSLDHLVRVIVVASGSAAAVFAARARTRAEGLVDELRTTRERLDRILGALSEAVTVQDADGGIVFANPAALKLMGLSRIDTA